MVSEMRKYVGFMSELGPGREHYRIWPQYRGGQDGWEQCFLSFTLPT